MRIAVCLKYGYDVDEVKIDPASGDLRLDIVPRKIGAYDLNALTEAARLKEAHDGTLQILAFGPPETKNGLKEAMAMGTDSAIIIADPSNGELDAQAAAEVVAAAIEKLGGFDLILCGEASIDDSTYQFVPRLAERLDVPNIAYASKLSVEGGSVVADRNLGNQAETLKAPLPCVVSVTSEINTPAKPTLMQVLQSKDKEITLWEVEGELGLSAEQLQEAAGLTTVKARGSEVPRKQVVIKDKTAPEAIDELLGLLDEEGVFDNE